MQKKNLQKKSSGNDSSQDKSPSKTPSSKTPSLKTSSQKIKFESPLTKISGVGPKRARAFEDVGIKNIGELLRYYPSRYIDRSTIVNIRDLSKHANSVVTVKGTVERVRREFFGRAKLRAIINDDSGAMEIIWYVRMMKIDVGETLLLTGKALAGRDKFLMIHPTFEKITNDAAIKPVIPVYSIREPMRDAGINQKTIRNAIERALLELASDEYVSTLPAHIESIHKFPTLETCLKHAHLPQDLHSINTYIRRLKYEELYKLALNLRWNKKKFALPGYAMTSRALAEKVREKLPFTLTASQEQAVATLLDDAAKPQRMHRLLQGDVGSGKTIVAFMASLPAVECGRQVAWMAPTETLARQTKNVVEKYLRELNISVGYLGADAEREKIETRKKIASGELQFIVGTHALFMPSVRFKNLGMVIIDEQHKFGSAQRMKLHEKDALCDFLMMSATPIPQTLAKTLYGDLDTLEITSRPNRASVSTHIVPANKRADMEKFILEQINGGARIFYVAPRIEAVSDSDDDNDGDGDDNHNNIAAKRSSSMTTSSRATSSRTTSSRTTPSKFVSTKTTSSRTTAPLSTVDSVVEKLKTGVLSTVPIHKLHGQMPQDERENAIAAFKDGPCGILVSTTIIEVGIDICDAAVMVIENPEYFGLAQLHQMRGRVGRGDRQSYCFLLKSDDAENDIIKNNVAKNDVNKNNVIKNDSAKDNADKITTERLKFFCGCNDGFEIAEWDLRHRGPGDSAGYKQSGWDDLCAADILEDAGLFQEILREVDAQFA